MSGEIFKTVVGNAVPGPYIPHDATIVLEFKASDLLTAEGRFKVTGYVNYTLFPYVQRKADNSQ